jgi:outer membrane protein assembly factor BamB
MSAGTGEIARIPSAQVTPDNGSDGESDGDAAPGFGSHVYGVAAIDDDTVLVVPFGTGPEVWDLRDGTRRRLSGAAGQGTRATPVVAGQYALVRANLEKDHPLLPPKFGGTSMFGIPALQCWDLASGELAWTRHGPRTDQSTWPCHDWVVPLRDGTVATITGYGEDTSLLVLDIATGDVCREVPMPAGYLPAPTELADGTLVFASGKKDRVQVHELPPKADRIAHRISVPPARSVRLVPDRDLLFRLDADGLHVHRPSTGEPLGTAQLPDTLGELAIDRDGRVAVVGDHAGDVHIFRVT